MEIFPETSSENVGKSVEKVEKGNGDAFKSEPEKAANLSHYFRVFAYSTPYERAILGFASFTSIGSGIAMPLMNVIFGRLVGNFTGFFVKGSTITPSAFSKQVNHNALILVYLFIAKFFLSWLSMFVFRTISIRISASLRLAYLKAIFAQSISALDKLPPGQAASTITSSAAILQIGISEKLSTFLQFSALVIAAYVVAFIYSWQLTLAASSVLLFMGIIYIFFIPVFIKRHKSMEFADSKATAIASESFMSIRMIVACGAEGRVAERYAGWVLEGMRRGLKITPLASIEMSPVFFAMYSTFALTFWFGVRLYTRGDVSSVSTVVIVLMSCMMAIMSMGNIVGPLLAGGKAASAASSFFEVIDAPVPKYGTLQAPEVSAEEDIVFSDVTFAYPSRPKALIHDNLSLRFEKGKITAIVGPSGSGKSTIVGLMEKWYALDSSEGSGSLMKSADQVEDTTDAEDIKISGSITISGHNLNDINMKWWRSQIGLVEQNPFIFNDTVYANVAFGLAGSPWEHENDDVKHKLVEEACREAFADDFIRKLPLAYETEVGEGGLKLSGGQRQRIAIARSIIKRPSILILDEATSSIDVRGERIVQAALDRVSKNRTTITIAHRLSTIKKADKIIVMRAGKVVEEGNHETLLANEDGVYAGLVNAQQISMGDTLRELIDENLDEKALAKLDTHDPDEGKKSGDDHQDAYKLKGAFNSIGTLFVEQRYLWKLYVFCLFAAMGCGAGTPIQSYLFGQLITVFEFTGRQLVDGSQHWSLMFFILAICIGVCYAILGVTCSAISMHISYSYRQQYFESIINKPIEFFDNKENSTGTLVSMLTTDPTQLQQLLGTNLALASIGFFNIIGCIAISFAFGWKLAIVALVSSMPIILTAGYIKLRYEIQFEKMQTAVFAESSQFASECIGAARTVTSLTLEDKICTRYHTLLQGHVHKAVATARYVSFVYAIADALPLCCMAFVFWYGGKLLSEREYNATQFFIIYIAIMQGSEASGQWFSIGPNLAQAAAAANRIFSFRATKTSRKAISTIVHEKQQGGAKLEFSDVHFKYPTRDIPIFQGLNMTIEKGQFAAIVGPSGCGKSTIIGLLERFYDIQTGTLRCDGTDITGLDVAEYRSYISLVAQEATLFQGSIRENILLGVEADSVSDEQIHHACRDAEIHEFIISLPEGYSTDVGSKGVALSGGQKQRISIARALLRNPRILLLDEATSSLDSESEKLVQSAFERAGKGRTMVVVAHRLATVQNADIIFVLGEGNGKVVEKGTHGELLRARGVYWQMCQSQALDR